MLCGEVFLLGFRGQPTFITRLWRPKRVGNSAKKIAYNCIHSTLRVCAFSAGVAERVAAERGETVGGTVGYQIRLERRASEHTKLLFVTTGILLRRLQADPQLEGVTHVILDEVRGGGGLSYFRCCRRGGTGLPSVFLADGGWRFKAQRKAPARRALRKSTLSREFCLTQWPSKRRRLLLCRGFPLLVFGAMSAGCYKGLMMYKSSLSRAT